MPAVGRLVLSGRAASRAHRNSWMAIWARLTPYWRALRRTGATGRFWARPSPGPAAKGYAGGAGVEIVACGRQPGL